MCYFFFLSWYFGFYICVFFFFFFFFSSRRRHTRCGRDWSSDVCSSDLEAYLAQLMKTEALRILYYALDSLPDQTAKVLRLTYLDGMSNQEAADELEDRKSVV